MTNRIDVKILGFAPDLDITTPGAIPDSGGDFIPTVNGVAVPPVVQNVGYPTLASACRGAVVVRLIDDTTRFFAGTRTKLYEGTGSFTWTDQSAGGGSYTGGAENRWRFAQFGQDTIATNRTDAVQMSSASGVFAALGGSPPKASLVETCNNFVMLFDYNDGVNDYPDGWWCSALGNDASWAASIATQAANGRLRDTPGKIFAAKRLGDIMVAYKQRSMYLGFNDGPPAIWRWQLVPGEVGCVSQEAIQSVIIDDVPCHIFAGFDGFYIFDGSRPRFIGKPLKNWFQQKSNAQFRYRMQSVHDPLTQNVKFFSPADAFAVTYNYRADRWGYESFFDPPQATLGYISSGVTYDGLGSLYSTYDNLPTAQSYDSPIWTSNAQVPALFNSTGDFQSLTGAPNEGFWGSCFSGDVNQFQTLIRVRPRFNLYPATENGITVIHSTQNLGTETDFNPTQVSLRNNKFDMQISSKFFSPFFLFLEAAEMTGYTLFLEEDGEE